MDLDERMTELEARIEAMDAQLEAVSAEFLGFKLAFTCLVSLIPVTEQDVTAAREIALAQAEDAIGSGDTPPEVALIVFSTIHKTTAIAGELWRHRDDPPQKPSAS